MSETLQMRISVSIDRWPDEQLQRFVDAKVFTTGDRSLTIEEIKKACRQLRAAGHDTFPDTWEIEV